MVTYGAVRFQFLYFINNRSMLSEWFSAEL